MDINQEELLEYGFCGDASITDVAIPEGITTLPEGLFAQCHNLVRVELPHSLVSVSSRVFKGCNQLKEVVFKNEETQFDLSSFEGCVALDRSAFPAKVQELFEALTSAARAEEERQAEKRRQWEAEIQRQQAARAAEKEAYQRAQQEKEKQAALAEQQKKEAFRQQAIANCTPFEKLVAAKLLEDSDQTLDDCIVELYENKEKGMICFAMDVPFSQNQQLHLTIEEPPQDSQKQYDFRAHYRAWSYDRYDFDEYYIKDVKEMGDMLSGLGFKVKVDMEDLEGSDDESMDDDVYELILDAHRKVKPAEAEGVLNRLFSLFDD